MLSAYGSGNQPQIILMCGLAGKVAPGDAGAELDGGRYFRPARLRTCSSLAPYSSDVITFFSINVSSSAW